MTLSVRYVQSNIVPNAATIPLGSTGKDSQLVAFDLTCTGGIAANFNANIFQWTGAGKIQSIMSYQVFNSTGLINVPAAAAAGTSVTIDPTGKIINVNIANLGTPITANSVIKLLLVIGNY